MTIKTNKLVKLIDTYFCRPSSVASDFGKDYLSFDESQVGLAILAEILLALFTMFD